MRWNVRLSARFCGVIYTYWKYKGKRLPCRFPTQIITNKVKFIHYGFILDSKHQLNS